MRKALAALLGLSLAAMSPAFGGPIYATGFENPPFILGQLLGPPPPPFLGQDGWTGVPILSPNAAIISKGLDFTGKQSVRVRGADLVHEDFINGVTKGYYDAIGSYRRAVEFDVGSAGFPIVRVQAAVRIDGPPACAQPTPIPCSNFFSASVAVRAASTIPNLGTAGIGELAISSDGKVMVTAGTIMSPGARVRPASPRPRSRPAPQSPWERTIRWLST